MIEQYKLVDGKLTKTEEAELVRLGFEDHIPRANKRCNYNIKINGSDEVMKGSIPILTFKHLKLHFPSINQLNGKDSSRAFGVYNDPNHNIVITSPRVPENLRPFILEDKITDDSMTAINAKEIYDIARRNYFSELGLPVQKVVGGAMVDDKKGLLYLLHERGIPLRNANIMHKGKFERLYEEFEAKLDKLGLQYAPDSKKKPLSKLYVYDYHNPVVLTTEVDFLVKK